MNLISTSYFLRRSKTLEFLNEIEQVPDIGSVSVYMQPGLSKSEIDDLLYKYSKINPIPTNLVEWILSSKNGAALFLGEMRKCLVLPPFPNKENVTFSGYIVEPIRLLLSSEFTVGIVLVHLGSYAVGVCQGESIISSKVGTGLVHGRHKKGGSSQQRFQRRRENQVHEFLDRVCLHTREQLESKARLLDYICYGGPHQTVNLMRKRCPFLQSFDDRVLPLLDVPSPRQRVLEAVVGRIWASRIIEWREE